MDSIPLKRCTKCGNEHPATLEYFRTYKGKLYCWCKSCERVAKRAYENTPHAKAKERERAKRYNAKPESKALRRKRQKGYGRKVVMSAEQRERKNIQQRVHRQTSEYRASSARRRAHKRNAEGSFTAKDIAAQKVAQTDKRDVLRCWWCGEPIKGKYHIDHRIPLSKDGTNYANNLCIACPTCNLSKGAKLPHEWSGRLL